MDPNEISEAIRELFVELGHCEPSDILEASELDPGAVFYGCRAVSYEEAGVLTRDDGFILRAANGDEFQITVVRSK